ncbi:TadE/TadG family type IV pilus assembly protein [Vibrio vulnificus]|uniref:TadE/TadG family type IV pilus assembly protein n=1 Tax=Vibrio vulnificus TaxID=672 RepID=UPI0019D4831B|nr:TadE/TadG family type IV pilus assembly protein [Vibrio vulnificus]MBN8105303.1 pilus assembly protein [Vibrio vulnificus]
MMKLNTQLSRTPLGFRQQTGHAGILFVMMVPFLFGVFFLGTEGARAVQDKARLAEAIETTALVLATENAADVATRDRRAEAFIHYYFPDAEIAQLTIDRTLCSETNCGMNANGSPFLEFSVSATIQQTKWFRSFDKEIDYYNVADFNQARKYQADGFDVTFAVNMSDTMLKKSGCPHMRTCPNYPGGVDADQTRLVKAKRIIFEITEALKEYNQTSTRPSTVAFTGFTWFANANETHDIGGSLFYDPIWYIDNTNRREWWEDGYVKRCNRTLDESNIELCKANGDVKSYADNGIYRYQRHYGENPYGIDNCVPIPSGGQDCGPHTTIPPEGSGIEPVGPNWNYHNINYASNVLGLAVFDLDTAPGSGASFGSDKVETLRNLGHLFNNNGKGWYYHDILSTDDFDYFNTSISGRADLNGATGEDILKGNDGFYVGYGVSTTVGFMRAGRILFRRLLKEQNDAHKKQFIIMITDGEENGFGFERQYNGEDVDDPVILRRFVETPFVEPDEYSYNGEINGVSGKKVYGTFNGICDYIRKKISAQTVNIDGVQHNVEGKILVVGVGGSDGKSLYNRELFETCVGDEALLFNEDNIDELIQVLKHGESGYISPIDS